MVAKAPVKPHNAGLPLSICDITRICVNAVRRHCDAAATRLVGCIGDSLAAHATGRTSGPAGWRSRWRARIGVTGAIAAAEARDARRGRSARHGCRTAAPITKRPRKRAAHEGRADPGPPPPLPPDLVIPPKPPLPPVVDDVARRPSAEARQRSRSRRVRARGARVDAESAARATRPEPVAPSREPVGRAEPPCRSRAGGPLVAEPEPSIRRLSVVESGRSREVDRAQPAVARDRPRRAPDRDDVRTLSPRSPPARLPAPSRCRSRRSRHPSTPARPHSSSRA